MGAYDVKVRGAIPVYLWGSSGITSNLDWPLLLTLRNDVAGDPITLYAESADGEKSLLGGQGAAPGRSVHRMVYRRGALGTAQRLVGPRAVKQAMRRAMRARCQGRGGATDSRVTSGQSIWTWGVSVAPASARTRARERATRISAAQRPMS
jgi:hypothetical protein